MALKVFKWLDTTSLQWFQEAAGAGSQFGAAEDFGSGTVGACPGATVEDAKPPNWGNMTKVQRRNWERARQRLRLKQAGK